MGISLAELRQLYFRMREEVLCGGLMSVSKKTDALEHLLRSTFGNMNMKDKEYPKYVCVLLNNEIRGVVMPCHVLIYMYMY